jgi:hypothetical protein
VELFFKRFDSKRGVHFYGAICGAWVVYLLEMEIGRQNKGCKLIEPTHTKVV